MSIKEKLNKYLWIGMELMVSAIVVSLNICVYYTLLNYTSMPGFVSS